MNIETYKASIKHLKNVRNEFNEKCCALMRENEELKKDIKSLIKSVNGLNNSFHNLSSHIVGKSENE